MQRQGRGGPPWRAAGVVGRAGGAVRGAIGVVAALALILSAVTPAAAADTTPPTLVSFSRVTPSSVGPGQLVEVSYTATDDSSGVKNVLFHFTDPLGNDHVLTGWGGGPTTLVQSITSSWVAGTYRLDEIDAVDWAGNQARYVAGATSFNLDSADFVVTGTAAAPKPTIRGTIDRSGLPPAEWQSAVHGYVVRADWAALQPTQGGPIITNNAIDQAIAQVRTLNAQHRGAQPPIYLKLRLLAGDSAPDWAKNIDGPPISVHDTTGSGYVTVGHFWTPDFGAAYQDFMTKVAALYDGVPEVRDVVVSRCTLATAEPFLRMTSDPTSVNNLRAAGFNVADDHTCQQQEVDVHNAVWKLTTSSVAFTPYQEITPTSTRVDESWTSTMIDYCRQQLGARCVLESNSIKDPSVPRGPSYGPMYAKIASMGPPIAYQTASPNNGLGSLCNTLGWAVSQGTGVVELPDEYVRDGVSNPAGMASYDKALSGAQPADTDTPTVPPNLGGTVTGPSSVNLTWSPSADNGYGVACYSVARNGTFLGTTMNTSLADTAATPSVPVTYTVTASDGAGYTSGPASVVVPTGSTTTTSTTSTTTTTVPPTTTTTVHPTTTTTSTTVPPTTTTTVHPTTTTTTVPPTTTSTVPPTTTSTTVKATPPSAPSGLTVTSGCSGTLLSWGAPGSNGGAPITAYRIYRGNWGQETYLTTTSTPPSLDKTGGQWLYYFYRVTAVNAAGLEGPPSADAGGYKSC
ncbi:MAG: hypothetical protein JO265_01020 [Acidimicrobiia bacterium]|nr:hypothetical protein [Acidimicrobiia bacterium]